ncbi:MAG TPA: M23 family metallopeptidase [Polyangium sp.]|nr:M23 family metallopeptidase [Polyangium sp.]
MALRDGNVGWIVGAMMTSFMVISFGGCGGTESNGAGGENIGGDGGTSVSSANAGGFAGAGGMGAGGSAGSGNSSSSSSSSTSSTSASSSSGATTDPCNGAADGNHCGSALGGLADHNSLYTCGGGMTVNTTPCALGCENNACKQQMQADPCASAMSGNGAYCGGSLVGGDANTLYNCQNMTTASQQVCLNGCQVNPPGVADACKSNGDPCANATSGNGLYCGSTISGDANALYNCQNMVTASKTDCPAGCQVNPPGQSDACKPTGGGSCCVSKPPGILTQSYSACGAGGSHYGIDLGTPVGTPIYAPMAGSIAGSALGFPNCYNNGCSSSCWNSFNYVKVKSDCGDPADSNKDLFVYYLHIDGLAAGISNGTHVEQGQLIAYSGNSGCSSGPHIHIETVSVAKGASASLSTCNSVNPVTRYCP